MTPKQFLYRIAFTIARSLAVRTTHYPLSVPIEPLHRDQEGRDAVQSLGHTQSDPPKCNAHGGGVRPVGAPRGNRNAVKHGFYAQPDPKPCTIDEIIADLAEKQRALSRYLDTQADELSAQDLTTLLSLHGQNASRLGRLLRDRRALSGEASDGISGAIAQALDELGTELGVEL